MKLVVSFYGMCLCVLDGRQGNRARGATVLLLNGAARPSNRTAARPQLPYHHPLLFVPAKHADLKRSSWSPVPTPDALVDTEGLIAGRHYGWSVAGLELTLGRGRGVALFENQAPDASGRLPDPASVNDKRAYLDWRRLPDLSRIAPGSRLRASFKTIGPNVLGIVRFSGGELRGAPPRNLAGNAVPWRFSDTFDQVITDRFEIHADLPGPALPARGFAGGRPHAIRLTGVDGKTVRLAVVHEASSADSALHAMAMGPTAQADVLPHYLAFYDALQGASVAALGPPRHGDTRGPAGRVPVIETPNCPPAVFPQP